MNYQRILSQSVKFERARIASRNIRNICKGRQLLQAEREIYGRRVVKDLNVFKVDRNWIANRTNNQNTQQLITAYRQHGHKIANINPLEKQIGEKLLKHERIETEGHVSIAEASIDQSKIIDFLHSTYCGEIGVEFMHLETLEEREWFAETFEKSKDVHLTVDKKINILSLLLKSQVFDNFLATKFGFVKRYSGEGCESMLASFEAIFEEAAEYGLEQVLVGIPHRGRLNFLTGMLNFSPSVLFRKMKGLPEFPPDVKASGDVLSHLTCSADLDVHGKKIYVTMVPNPSHLEANVPVIMGKTRSRQKILKDGTYSVDTSGRQGDKAICIQVHGDAAFTGQGVCMEVLGLANIPHFTIGGSVHLIVNNQLGFTTPAKIGRSSRYSSDLAKMISAPVLHVNGDYPEEVVRATRLAMAYRNRFRKDVFVDIVCYRRWGHNELDDPSFTNPAMYVNINERTTVPNLYANKLINEAVVTTDDIINISKEHTDYLNKHFSTYESYTPKNRNLEKQWSGLVHPSNSISTWDTGVDTTLLKYIGAKSVQYPQDFTIHPHLLKTHVQGRLKKLQSGTAIDWSTAEALAIGSLLYQSFDTRFSGQDVGRGTFSHRHAMMVDQKTDQHYIPLNDIDEKQGKFEVVNSTLSEVGVLGFEYGYSIDNPNTLVVWEAQFGDFFNTAQVIIDTYITSGETKWLLQSGIVMLLPHGYDGMGPEHTSCRIERFLQMTDSSETEIDSDQINFNFAHPTTPAQYFHLLRRQMVRNFRKPLVIASPKVILRLSDATSSLTDMRPGSTFNPVLTDPDVTPSSVKKIVFCSGKHYYNLRSYKKDNAKKDVAIVRVEVREQVDWLAENLNCL